MHDNIARVTAEEMDIEGLTHNLEEKIEWGKKKPSIIPKVRKIRREKKPKKVVK